MKRFRPIAMEFKPLIDQLLSTLDVRIQAFATCEACPDWRLVFGSAKEASVHYVLNGSGQLHLPGFDPIELNRDILVVLPKGVSHTFDNGSLSFEPEPGTARENPSLPTIRAGAPVEGRACLIVACGTIQASFGGGAGLFDQLTTPIVESFKDQSLAWGFKVLLDELRTPSLGTRALTEAYLQQAVLHLLRRQLGQPETWPSWLGPFSDRGLAPAVLAILNQPAHPFTIAELASTAGVGAGEFATRFTSALGLAPIEFLKQVRLYRAARLLEATELPTKAVATSVGYKSRSYFSRVFRASFGVGPFEYRARLRASTLTMSDSPTG